MHLRIGSGGQDCDSRNQDRSKSTHLSHHLEVTGRSSHRPWRRSPFSVRWPRLVLVDDDLQRPGGDINTKITVDPIVKRMPTSPTQYVGWCGADYRRLASVGLFNFCGAISPGRAPITNAYGVVWRDVCLPRRRCPRNSTPLREVPIIRNPVVGHLNINIL